MSDGAPVAAPVPTTGPAGAAPVDAKVTAPSDTKKPAAPAAPSWGEKDDAELLERLKRSPYSKLKVDGKEVGIESVEDLKRRNLDAMRGRGANRVVEEAKKAAEEGRKAKEAFEQTSKLIERARRGDEKALRELGLVPDTERQQAEEQFAQLPPEVQEVVRQNQELSQRLRAKEQAEQQALQEREKAEKERLKETTLKRAREMLPDLMADIREEFMDVDLPDVLQVMEVLRSEGNRLGVDYDVSHVKAMVEQLREGGLESRIGQMKPAAAAKRLAPIMATMKPSELRAALGDSFLPIAKAISKAYVAHQRGEREKPQQQLERTEKEAAPAPRTPLRPNRRW